MSKVSDSRVADLARLGAALTIPLGVGAVAGFATSGGVATWYPALVKPSFNPPAWVFGPTWTVLYLLMGVALYLILRQGFGRPNVRMAVALFALQLGLNGLWSIVFFGLRSPGWAFAEIILLWLAIVVTLGVFRKLSRAAAWLFVPYVAWVTFAAVLNGSIWMLNR